MEGFRSAFDSDAFDSDAFDSDAFGVRYGFTIWLSLQSGPQQLCADRLINVVQKNAMSAIPVHGVSLSPFGMNLTSRSLGTLLPSVQRPSATC